MSRSQKKHPCCGWSGFGARSSRKWKQVVNGQLRSKNKQNLRALLNDEEGDELFVEDRWSLSWDIGEKSPYRGFTLEHYIMREKNRSYYVLDEEDLITWFRKYYLGK